MTPPIIKTFADLVEGWQNNGACMQQIVRLSSDELKDIRLFMAEQEVSSLHKELENRKHWWSNYSNEKYSGYNHTPHVDTLFEDTPHFIYKGFEIFIKVG
jgi:hypothetical protein